MAQAKNASLWRNIAAVLDEMDDQTLRALLKDLFELNPQNRAFLASWIGDENAGLELLKSYRQQIESQFYGKTRKPRYDGRIDTARCRSLLREYQNVTSATEQVGGFDVRGDIDLALHYVEIGTRYANDVGLDEGRVYDSLARTADEIADLCAGRAGKRWAVAFLPRVDAAASAAQDIGWGFGDVVSDLADAVRKIAESKQAPTRGR